MTSYQVCVAYFYLYSTVILIHVIEIQHLYCIVFTFNVKGCDNTNLRYLWFGFGFDCLLEFKNGLPKFNFQKRIPFNEEVRKLPHVEKITLEKEVFITNPKKRGFSSFFS